MPFLSTKWTSTTWTRLYLMILLLCAQAILLSTQNAEAARPVIVGAIDESRLVSLEGNHHPLAVASADQGAAPDSLQLGRTILVLKISALQQSALKRLVDDQQNSHSPRFHQWLTPAQYGAQFGAAPEDIEKITQWLKRYGLQVEPQLAGRNVIMFSGSHAQFKAAFHAELHIYNFEGKSYFANATDPQIPQAFAAVVSGFSSLNNFPRKPLHTAPALVHRDGSTWKRMPTNGKAQPQFTTSGNGGTVNAIGPYDLATIYNVKPLWDAGIDGTDQTIAILAQSNINPADVDYFRSTFRLPAKKLNIVVYGPDPGLNLNYEDEADLDVEWAGAVAKNATVDLVVAGTTTTSNGIDGAAAYVINNNLASILSVSYGACELFLGAAGNAYYNQIWEQAAAQGITVLVATGDSGSATCDAHASYAYEGLQVSGIASTPYNIAVGGTDLYGTYADNAKYWNAANDPATLASAKSYIPELTWNDSCASPELLQALQHSGSTTDASTTALCNDPNQPDWLTTTAGSGGYSKCTTDGCTAGYPKPAWQSGVTGIPADKARDLPDVSLMAGNGLWGSFYVYCQSDVLTGGVCDVNQSLEGGGGTSFSAPVFAGMMALVQQKAASMQGNVNYVLYKLATAQYGSTEAASCDSNLVEGGNACTFYDVSHGTIAVPCYTIGLDCTPPAGMSIGILPGFDTAAGFDLATGLGSVNAYNLVEGWSTASASFLPTATSLTLSPAATSASTVYGSSLPLVVSVAAVAPATGVPSGDAGITTSSVNPNNGSVAEVTLDAGQGSVAAELLQGGTYQLFARYAGDASFSPSASKGLAVTITPGPVTVSLTATRSIVQQGQKVTLAVVITGISNGVIPTGTVTISNGTTGVTYGTLRLMPTYSSITAPLSDAYVTIDSSQLQLGDNTINASYSGDANYAPVTLASSMVSLTGSFTTSINPLLDNSGSQWNRQRASGRNADRDDASHCGIARVLMPNIGRRDCLRLQYAGRGEWHRVFDADAAVIVAADTACT